MLRFTGHPLYDVGVATVTVFVGKRDPSQVTADDLEEVVEYIEREYCREPLKSFLGAAAFTNNAWFKQFAFENQPEKRADYAARLLKHFNEESVQPSDDVCVFTGEPATTVRFSDKLPAGRAFRQHVPLTTGEGVINFYPYGQAGLPISGKASVCIHAFPLGCANCGGRLLAVHSDNPAVMLEFAFKFLRENKTKVMFAQQAGSTKLAESSMRPKTLLLDTLCAAYEMGEETSFDVPTSITAYHLTNNLRANPLDRRNPPLEIYYLPLQIIRFIREVSGPDYSERWRKIRERAWQLQAPSKAKKKGSADDGSKSGTAQPRRNYLYEDLFDLPDNAPLFVRRYFLRIPERRASADDPRRLYSLRDETDLVSWGITELFLGRVMGMDKERVEQIKTLGDRLAQYIAKENDRKFFTAFYSESNYGEFRNALIRANVNHIRNGGQPLIGLDSYIDVFEEGDEVARTDWRFARDLVLIRMIEELYRLGWIGKNTDTLPASKEEE